MAASGRCGAHMAQYLLYLPLLCLLQQVSLQSDQCGKTSIQLDREGALYQVQSPSYPSPVPSGLHCVWMVNVPEDLNIALNVTDLNIREHRDVIQVINIDIDDIILTLKRRVKVHRLISSGSSLQISVNLSSDFYRMNTTGLQMEQRFWFELQAVRADSSQMRDCTNSSGSYLCDSGDVCIDSTGKCDAVPDCPDGSDELECRDVEESCSTPEYRYCINSSTCLQKKYHCDNVRDCTFGEDEMACASRFCPKNCVCNLGLGNYLRVNCTFNPDILNNWSSLPTGTTTLSLRKIGLTDIATGMFASMPYVVNLHLQRNNLTRLRTGMFDGLGSLESLRLNENDLTSIDEGAFQPLEHLRVLRLESNDLTDLTKDMFMGLRRLESLRAGKNRIQTLKTNTFRHLTSLLTLRLEGNEISTIESGAFRGLSSLTNLELSNNSLVVLKRNVFANLTSLQILEITDNPWKIIEPGAFNDLKKLSVLALSRQAEDRVDFTADMHEFEHIPNLYDLRVDDKRMCCLMRYKEEGTYWCSIKDNSISQTVAYYTCNRLMRNPLLRIFIWLIGVSALIGNLFIIYWRLRTKESGKRSQSVLILNLAFSDLVMGLYMLIIAGADAHFREAFFLHSEYWREGALCRFAGFMFMFSSEASIFFITMISIDRFLCVVFPFGKKWLRLESVRLASLVLWGLSFLGSLLPLLLQDKVDDLFGLEDTCVALPFKKKLTKSTLTGTMVSANNSAEDTNMGTTKRVYGIFVYLGLNFTCCVIVMLCYITIAFVVIVKLPSKNLHRRKDKAQRKREMAMTRRMLLIVGTDFCCWMPVILIGILSRTGSLDVSSDVYAWFVVFVMPINCALNPYLYTFSNAKLDCCPCRRQGLSLNAIKMKPVASQDKDANHRSRSGTHTFL